MLPFLEMPRQNDSQNEQNKKVSRKWVKGLHYSIGKCYCHSKFICRKLLIGAYNFINRTKHVVVSKGAIINFRLAGTAIAMVTLTYVYFPQLLSPQTHVLFSRWRQSATPTWWCLDFRSEMETRMRVK